MRGHRTKSGGFSGNLVKLGGSQKKLKISGDMRPENMASGNFKKAGKQAHKKV